MKKTLFLVAALSMAVFGMSGAWASIEPVDMTYMNDSFQMFGLAGMIVNKSSLTSVFTGLKTIFNNALKSETGDWAKTAMEVISNAKFEDYKWLERFPTLRKWVGEKHIKALKAGNYTVKNEPFEATIAVDRDDIEDDTLGAYELQAKAAGQSATELHDLLLDELKNEAFVNPGIDGQPFYDTDHEVQGESVSNKLTTVLSASTAALAKSSYEAGRLAMMQFKDEEGKPLKLVPNLLEVPPALESVANKLMTADKLDDGSVNPYKGQCEVIVNAGLLSSTQWMLHNTRKPVKPFIIQMRKRPVFVSQTDMDSDDVFMKGEYKFGIEARAAGVYAFWQLSVGSTGLG